MRAPVVVGSAKANLNAFTKILERSAKRGNGFNFQHNGSR
jgi:hypothetical protein